jgi:hypothetical protein
MPASQLEDPRGFIADMDRRLGTRNLELLRALLDSVRDSTDSDMLRAIQNRAQDTRDLEVLRTLLPYVGLNQMNQNQIMSQLENIWGHDSSPHPDQDQLTDAWLLWNPPDETNPVDSKYRLIKRSLNGWKMEMDDCSTPSPQTLHNYCRAIELLIQQYPDTLLHIPDKNKRSVFHQLADLGPGELFCSVLDSISDAKFFKHLMTEDIQRKTPLRLAIARLDFKDKLETLRIIGKILETQNKLDKQCDLEAVKEIYRDRGSHLPDENHVTYWRNRQHDIVRLLLNHQPSRISHEVVESVAFTKDPDLVLVEKLLNSQQQQDVLNRYFYLHKAVGKGEVQLIRILLRADPSLTVSCDGQNRYPMHLVRTISDSMSQQEIRNMILPHVVRSVRRSNSEKPLKEIRDKLYTDRGKWIS